VDRKLKRKLAEAVRRDFSRRMLTLGFARTKPTFWTRSADFAVQFVHLHSFTHSPSFRVHLGVRALSDTFPAPALNGLMSCDGWALAARKYSFDFSASADTSKCADELSCYVSEVCLPWFDSFASTEALLAPGGPLSDDARLRLSLAVEGHADPSAVAASRAMLGLDPVL